MKLLANWQDVLFRAWSVRLVAIAGILTGLETATPYLNQVINIPAGLFAALSGLASAAALVARILAQKGLDESAPAAPAEEAHNG